jgi:hypothetical protein
MFSVLSFLFEAPVIPTFVHVAEACCGCECKRVERKAKESETRNEAVCFSELAPSFFYYLDISEGKGA